MILKNAKFYDKLTACFGNLDEFERHITEIATKAGINFADFPLDHLAVRMNDWETAERWRAMLLEGATLLKESEVNGRPIALFKLFEPISFLGQSVSVIELPFPKGKIYPKEGWEHAECVFPFQPQESVEQWTARTFATFRLTEKADLYCKASQVAVKGERLANPSVAITFSDRTKANRCCLKLHPYPIEAIIQSETFEN